MMTPVRFLFLPISYHHPRPLPQCDLRIWPSSDGSPIRCDCRFQIIDAGDVLDDVVTSSIPNIDAEREVGLRLHRVAPPNRFQGGCYPRGEQNGNTTWERR